MVLEFWEKMSIMEEGRGALAKVKEKRSRGGDEGGMMKLGSQGTCHNATCYKMNMHMMRP